MHLKKYILVSICLIASITAYASDLSDKLNSSSYVLLMRHTSAPGIGDPANYTLKDCKTQRNLSTEGREQAIFIGRWLKKQGVIAAEVHTSDWCRCKDTAQLLNFGKFKVEPALASFFDDMSKSKEANTQLQEFISRRLASKGDKALIMVTHHVNIVEYAGENIASGDMVLAKVSPLGELLSYKRIPRPE